jgi:hypothetical protein
MQLVIRNDGPLIVETNYWETERARAGYFYLSTNAGCMRLLAPPQLGVSNELSGVRHVVVSMLPLTQWRERQFAIEWMAEDDADEPWACHLSPGQVDRAPRRSDVTGTWRTAVYEGSGAPTIELEAHLRWVDSLPCLLPLEQTIGRGDA